MDIDALQQKLINNKDDILKIVENLGFKDIKDKGRYCNFPRITGDNPAAIVVYYNSLRYVCFTHNDSGNIFTLVMRMMNVKFIQAVDWICKILNYDDIKIKKITYPFGGFYRNFIVDQTRTEDDDYIYPEEILRRNGVSLNWFKDGVDYKTQERFELFYDEDHDAMYIPIRNIKGNLIGIKARSNNLFCEHDKRFWSPYPYNKSCVVYGLYQNYTNIIRKHEMVIVESEKAVMQLSSMGINIGVAIGGHSISVVQAKIIKSLMLDTVVVAFDEGICEDEIKYETKKIRSKVSAVNIKNLGYIYDRDNLYLIEGSKDSPSDNGIDCFKGLCRECVTWI